MGEQQVGITSHDIDRPSEDLMRILLAHDALRQWTPQLRKTVHASAQLLLADLVLLISSQSLGGSLQPGHIPALLIYNESRVTICSKERGLTPKKECKGYSPFLQNLFCRIMPTHHT